MKSDRFRENKFKFLTNASNWAPGQLESEIESGAWSVEDDVTQNDFFKSFNWDLEPDNPNKELYGLFSKLFASGLN